MSEPKIIGLREANTILGKIKDSGVAKQIRAILFNNEEKVIYCKKCKKDIGIVDLSGDKPTYIKEMGIMSARQRFGGEWGFECACGNDSRLASQEKGIITSDVPSREDINKIFNNVKKKQTKVIKTDNAIECDGFIIKG